MQVTQSNERGVNILSLNGKLDAMTSSILDNALAPVLSSETPKIIIDFADLSYVSSAGLRVLLKTAKQLQTIQGRLVLCNMKDFIREVFDISGFSSILTICESCEKALVKIEE
ncbi:MAG: STAS domain-containing protein [Candidatus Cloacimonadaceae bacterium]|nr:STAS domain-containing protein [Candidatus Cloacimonadaceae bacterium]